MNIFRIFFKRRDDFFKLNESVLEYPERVNKDIVKYVQQISADEKDFLNSLLKILQRHLNHHSDFWIKNSFTREYNDTDKDDLKIFKSFLELMLLDWTTITKEFQRKKVPERVGHVLWFMIYYSFESFDHRFFKDNDFKNYKDAFYNREQVYPEILSDLYKKEKRPSQRALQNLYTLLIANPLSNRVEQLSRENFGSSLINVELDPFNFDENTLRVLIFQKSFMKNLIEFEKAIVKLIDKNY